MHPHVIKDWSVRPSNLSSCASPSTQQSRSTKNGSLSLYITPQDILANPFLGFRWRMRPAATQHDQRSAARRCTSTSPLHGKASVEYLAKRLAPLVHPHDVLLHPLLRAVVDHLIVQAFLIAFKLPKKVMRVVRGSPRQSFKVLIAITTQQCRPQVAKSWSPRSRECVLSSARAVALFARSPSNTVLPSLRACREARRQA